LHQCVPFPLLKDTNTLILCANLGVLPFVARTIGNAWGTTRGNIFLNKIRKYRVAFFWGSSGALMSALSKAGVGKGRNYGPPAAPCPQLLGACQASMHSSWTQNFPCCPQTSAATAPRNIIIVGTVVIIIINNNK